MNECKGTQWSEELDGKDSIEWLGGEDDLELNDLESRGFPFSCTPATGDNTSIL